MYVQSLTAIFFLHPLYCRIILISINALHPVLVYHIAHTFFVHFCKKMYKKCMCNAFKDCTLVQWMYHILF